MSTNHVHITMPEGQGYNSSVLLDGRYVPNLTAVDLHLDAGNIPTVALNVVLGAGAVEGQAHVIVSDENAALLKSLGWTPPAITIPKPVPSHEWTSTIKRPDGVSVSVTVTVPPGHPAIQPDPTALFPDWALREMNELTYMCANSAHSIIENNWVRRGVDKRQNRYWSLNLDVTPEAIEAGK